MLPRTRPAKKRKAKPVSISKPMVTLANALLMIIDRELTDPTAIKLIIDLAANEKITKTNAAELGRIAGEAGYPLSSNPYNAHFQTKLFQGFERGLMDGARTLRAGQQSASQTDLLAMHRSENG